ARQVQGLRRTLGPRPLPCAGRRLRERYGRRQGGDGGQAGERRPPREAKAGHGVLPSKDASDDTRTRGRQKGGTCFLAPHIHELRDQEAGAERRENADERPLFDAALEALLGASRVPGGLPAAVLAVLGRSRAFVRAGLAPCAGQRLQVLARLVDLAAQAVDVTRDFDGHVMSSSRLAGARVPDFGMSSILTPRRRRGYP